MSHAAFVQDLIDAGSVVVREQKLLQQHAAPRHVLYCECGDLLPARADLTSTKWTRHCKQSAKHKDWHRRAHAPMLSTTARASSTAAPGSSSTSGFGPFDSGPRGDYGTAAATTGAHEVIDRENTLISAHTAAAAATAHGVIVGDAAVASAQVPHPWALL